MMARALPTPPPPCAPGDVVDANLVRVLPGALDACRRLKDAGFALVVVSNQGVVARGGAGIDDVRAVNRALDRALGGTIDAWYFCPFHPKGHVPEFTREHPWRKPGEGMIVAAAIELSIDLSESWLVGDAERDVEAGLAAGIEPARCLLIGRDVPDMTAAAARVLGE